MFPCCNLIKAEIGCGHFTTEHQYSGWVRMQANEKYQHSKNNKAEDNIEQLTFVPVFSLHSKIDCTACFQLPQRGSVDSSLNTFNTRHATTSYTWLNIPIMVLFW